MEHRQLGNTGLELPVLSFGASSLGQEFRQVDLDEALRAVRVALDLGMNFIDTSPFYGRGMSEVLLGIALRGVPRESYMLGTKLGRYDLNHFDFSAKRVAESIDVSLHRMGVEHLDIILCHDIEFVEMGQIVSETLPALREIQQQGKVRYVGISGYPMKTFRYVLDRSDLDVILSYNHYTLQNTMFGDLVPYLKAKNVGIFGTSTGGGMTLAMVLRAKMEHLPLPGAIAPGTPWSDMTKTGDSFYANEMVDNVLVSDDGFLHAAALLYANGHDLKDPLLSPVYGDMHGFPPTILTTGTRDLFLSNTVRVHRKLREAGVEAVLQVFEGESHAQYYRDINAPETKEYNAEIAGFFDRHLGR